MLAAAQTALKTLRENPQVMPQLEQMKHYLAGPGYVLLNFGHVLSVLIHTFLLV